MIMENKTYTVIFYEKWDDRIERGNLKEICDKVLSERIKDTGGYGLSIWYEEDTENAQKALDRGDSFHYLCSREDYEYEYFEYIPDDIYTLEEDTTI